MVKTDQKWHTRWHTQSLQKRRNPEKPMFSGVFSSGGGIRNTAQNAGETVSTGGSAVKSAAAAIQSGASWAEIRVLILACRDLSPKARQQLIAIGDGCRD